MNGQPPKMSEVSSAPASSSQCVPSGSNRLFLGMGVGLLAGLLLATMFWLPVGWLLVRKSRMHQAEQMATARLFNVRDRATIAEIDAATGLSFENNRVSVYDQIASRPSLSPEAQVHLVEAIFRHLSFENNRLTLLLKLTANPSFSPAGKEAILKRLNNLSFENNRQAVLQAMGQR
jgi:hypothetical protein